MRREELEKHTKNKMRCKNCGKEFDYFDIVMFMDSADLPGNLVSMVACDNCGKFGFDEIER